MNSNTTYSNTTFEVALARLGSRPVLVDVGASGDPPAVWDPIASESIYVGFDPDLREMREIKESRFHRSYIVDKAVTWDDRVEEAPFFFTHSPYCSSLLKPDSPSLSDFLFADSFRVTREGSVRATSLGKVVSELGLGRIDWLKTDTQGADLRLFASLPPSIQETVLTVDLEPGLIAAYEGEDLFTDVHREMTKTGFWLSDLQIGKAIRLKRETLEAFSREAPALTEPLVSWACKSTPAYVEIRYLRSIAWLVKSKRERRDYLLLWVFAMLDRQAGFAMDLVLAYESRFDRDETSSFMRNECVDFFKRAAGGKWKSRAKALVPPIVGRAAHRLHALSFRRPWSGAKWAARRLRAATR